MCDWADRVAILPIGVSRSYGANRACAGACLFYYHFAPLLGVANKACAGACLFYSHFVTLLGVVNKALASVSM